MQPGPIYCTPAFWKARVAPLWFQSPTWKVRTGSLPSLRFHKAPAEKWMQISDLLPPLICPRMSSMSQGSWKRKPRKEVHAVLNHFDRVQLFATPWTVARHFLYPWGLSRQEYWSGLPCPPPGDLPNPGIKPRSLALQADSVPSEPPGKPSTYMKQR